MLTFDGGPPTLAFLIGIPRRNFFARADSVATDTFRTSQSRRRAPGKTRPEIPEHSESNQRRVRGLRDAVEVVVSPSVGLIRAAATATKYAPS